MSNPAAHYSRTTGSLSCRISIGSCRPLTAHDLVASSVHLRRRVADAVRGRASLLSPLVGSVGTSLAGQVVILVSGVIAARLLGPEDRGNLALLILIPLAISQLGSLGVPLAVTYEFSKDVDLGRGTLRNIARPVIIWTAVLVLADAAITAILVLGRDVDVQVAAVFMLVMVPADTMRQYGLAILQGRQDFSAFNTLRLLPAIAYSAIAVVAFVMDAKGLPLFALSYAGSYFAVAAITFAIALRRSPPKQVPGASTASAMVRFGMRGLLGTVSPLETLRLDQAIVGVLLAPAALGMYVVGVSFTNLPRFVAQGIGVVAYPQVAAEHDASRAQRSMWRFFWLSVLVCTGVVIPLELAAPRLVPTFFGDAFTPAVGIMQILLVASLFLSARRVLTDASRGFGLPTAGTTAEVASWLALVPCIALLAPRFGASGVAMAFTIAAALSLTVLLALVAVGRRGRPAIPLLVEEPAIDAL
jgi:O-antigen/teichoic acid export membrane protein